MKHTQRVVVNNFSKLLLKFLTDPTLDELNIYELESNATKLLSNISNQCQMKSIKLNNPDSINILLIASIKVAQTKLVDIKYIPDNFQSRTDALVEAFNKKLRTQHTLNSIDDTDNKNIDTIIAIVIAGTVGIFLEKKLRAGGFAPQLTIPTFRSGSLLKEGSHVRKATSLEMIGDEGSKWLFVVAPAAVGFMYGGDVIYNIRTDLLGIEAYQINVDNLLK